MTLSAPRRSGALAAAVAAAAVALAAPGWAEPGVPVDPAPPADPGAPAPAPQTILGSEVLVDPLTALSGLMASSPQPPAVGLAPLPADTVSNGPGPDPMGFIQLLLPQNFRMPTDDQASPYPLAPNDVPSPFARIDAWKGVHALAHGGLGRMPGADLGQPLPGTAAPPGVNLPPGLEQFYEPLIAPPAAPPPP